MYGVDKKDMVVLQYDGRWQAIIRDLTDTMYKSSPLTYSTVPDSTTSLPYHTHFGFFAGTKGPASGLFLRFPISGSSS